MRPAKAASGGGDGRKGEIPARWYPIPQSPAGNRPVLECGESNAWHRFVAGGRTTAAELGTYRSDDSGLVCGAPSAGITQRAGQFVELPASGRVQKRCRAPLSPHFRTPARATGAMGRWGGHDQDFGSLLAAHFAGLFQVCSGSFSKSSKVWILSYLRAYRARTLAGEAVRSNHAAEHQGYWLATATKPCLTGF